MRPATDAVQAAEHADIAARVDQESVPARRARDIAEVNAAGQDAPSPWTPCRAGTWTSRNCWRWPARSPANPEALAPHIAFDDEQRHYVSLHRDTHVDIWLLCWTPQNDTGWHDHDISSGAVAVTQGTLTEHNLAIGTPSIETEIHAGSAFSFGPDHIHRLTGRDAGSVSVHAYSPPLWRMGQYTLGAGGQLRRKSVSYADELRPLDDMA